MKNKQTAVDWLFEKLWETPKDKLTWYAILEQAKAMHREEIIDAFWSGDNSDCTSEDNSKEYAEQYYNEQFKTKQYDKKRRQVN